MSAHPDQEALSPAARRLNDSWNDHDYREMGLDIDSIMAEMARMRTALRAIEIRGDNCTCGDSHFPDSPCGCSYRMAMDAFDARCLNPKKHGGCGACEECKLDLEQHTKDKT